MVFHVRECRAGRGHVGDIDRRICFALIDVGVGLGVVFYHVAHAVQAVFAVFRAVDGDEGIEALFCGHLIVAVRTVHDVIEAAVGLTEREKVFYKTVTVLYEAAVIQVHAQLAECDHDLRDGLDVRRSPRRKAALAVLHVGEISQCLVRCGFDRLLILIFCQRLQCHCSNIYIGIAGAGQAPAAVLHLVIQDFIDVELPGRLCLCGGIFGNLIITGIQRNERPDGTVQTLPDGFVKIAQRREKIVARDLGRISANGSQREDDAGILRIFSFMQHAVAVFDVLFNARVIFIVIICGNGIPRTGKTDNCPFAADGADLRRFDSGHHISGAALYFILDAGCRQCGNGQRQKDCKGQNPSRNSFDSSHLYFPL